MKAIIFFLFNIIQIGKNIEFMMFSIFAQINNIFKHKNLMKNKYAINEIVKKIIN